MERVTGVVMETKGNHVVLITPKGEFKRVRITGKLPGIGEEVHIPVARKRFFNLPRASWAAVAAAVILLLSASPLLTVLNQPPEFATAYVSIDIGPSIELTRSNRENVLEAHAYNSEGKKILEKLNLKGMKIDEAVTSITREAVEMGYIQNVDGNSVLISVAPLPDSGLEKDAIEKAVLASANNVLADSKINREVKTISVPSDIRESARVKGMSTGKYALLIEAVNEGLTVTEEEMKQNSIDEVISQAGGQTEMIIGMAQTEKQFEIKEQKYIALAGAKKGNDDTRSGIVDIRPSAGSTDTGSDTETTDGKIRFIDPIIRNGWLNDIGEPAGSQKPAAAVTTVPGSQGAGSQQPGTPQNGADTPAAGPVEDPNNVNDKVYENTRDNYMGPELPGDITGTEEPMYILRPKF